MVSDQSPTTTPTTSNGLPDEVITCLQNARFVSGLVSYYHTLNLPLFLAASELLFAVSCFVSS